MPDEPSMNDPGAMWRNQPTEKSSMTMEMIQRKTSELHAKTRKELLLGIGVSAAVAAIAACGIAWVDHAGVRALFVLGVLWSVAGQYFLNRGMWSAPTEDAGSITGLASYRREVERRRRIATGFLLWRFGPAAFAIAVLIASILGIAMGQGRVLSMVPFLVCVAVWIVGVFIIRARDLRNLRREIDELTAIEKANR
jgi:hypothetical protein